MTEPVRSDHTIVVGIDGSAPSDAALMWAMTAALAFDAQVVAVHAVGLLEGPHREDESHRPSDEMVVRLRHEIGRTFEHLDRLPELRVVFEPGAPGDALLRVAEDEHADLVVVGRRGCGEPSQLDLGSTSRSVAARGTVPVVVVPSTRSV